MKLKFGLGWALLRRIVTDPLLLTSIPLVCRMVANMGQMHSEMRRVGITSHRLCLAYESVVEGVSLKSVWDTREELFDKGAQVMAKVVGEIVKVGLETVEGSTFGATKCIFKIDELVEVVDNVIQGTAGNVAKAVDFVSEGLGFTEKGSDTISKKTDELSIKKLFEEAEKTIKEKIQSVADHLEKATKGRLDKTDLTQHDHFRIQAKPPLCDELAMEDAVLAVGKVVRGIQLMTIAGMSLLIVLCCAALAGLNWSTSRKIHPQSRFKRMVMWPITFLNYPNAHRCLLMAILSLVALQVQRNANQKVLASATHSFGIYAKELAKNINPHLEFAAKDLLTQAGIIWDWFPQVFPSPRNDMVQQIKLNFAGDGLWGDVGKCFFILPVNKFADLFSVSIMDPYINLVKDSPYRTWTYFDHWHALVMDLIDPSPNVISELEYLEARLARESFIIAAIFLSAYSLFILIAIFGTIANIFYLGYESIVPSPEAHYGEIPLELDPPPNSTRSKPTFKFWSRP